MNLLKADDGNSGHFYLYNAHGDVVQLTDDSGTVTKDYDYDAFGVERNRDANDSNPFRYCAEYFNNETGTIYLRAKYYAPTIGRFTQQDTVFGVSRKMPNKLEIIDPLSLNLYTYTHNNPVLYVDQSGHWVHIAIGALAGAVIGGIVDLGSQLIFNGGSFSNVNWRSVGASTIAGVVTGAMAGATAGLSLTVSATMAAGAMIGANGYLTYNLFNGTEATLAGLLFAAEFGVLFSGVTYKVGHPSYGTQGPGGVLNGANFAQKTYSKNFSAQGQKIYSDIAGQKVVSVSDLAIAIKTGAIKASDIPVQYVVRDGNKLIFNTRTAQALMQAGIPRSSWNAVNVTGKAQFERMLSEQLDRNGLSSSGVSSVRIK